MATNEKSRDYHVEVINHKETVLDCFIHKDGEKTVEIVEQASKINWKKLTKIYEMINQTVDYMKQNNIQSIEIKKVN